MFLYEGATDPEVWGKFFGALGPGGFVLVVMAMGVLIVTLIVGGFLLFWRGSDKLGLVGFGKEYQATRIAQERQALAMERTEKVNGRIEGFLEDLPRVFRDTLREFLSIRGPAPMPPPVSPPNGARVSSPNLPPLR